MYVQHTRSQNRPIRYRIVKQLGFARRPFDEPLTPGLRNSGNSRPIGFLTDAYSETKPDVFDMMNEGLSATEIIERVERMGWRDRMRKRD